MINTLHHIKFFVLVLLLGGTSLLAQQDSIVIDLPIIIKASKFDRNKNDLGIQTIDIHKSIPAVTNLAQALHTSGNAYIKNYGPGSLATPSIQGGSAPQTLINWNGVPLSSPMLGLLDLSLIPVRGNDDIALEIGGNSQLWGSGAMAGIISIANKPIFKEQREVELEYSFGSFGSQKILAQAQMGNKDMQYQVATIFQEGQNNYPFLTSNGEETRIQSNAAFRQVHLFQDLHLRLGAGHFLSLHLWKLEAFRQIPPLTVQTRSSAKQTEDALRTVANYRFIGRKSETQVIASYFVENLRFEDPEILLNAPSDFNTISGEITHRRDFGKYSEVMIGMASSRTFAFAEAYQKRESENRISFFASHGISKGRFDTKLGLRISQADNNTSPIMPLLTFQYQINSSWSAQCKVSRNFRFPTLNDRFWIPGGNPNLKAENAWAQRIHVRYQQKTDQTTFQFSGQVYNRFVKDWILWSKIENQNYWSANNIAQVWSRGIQGGLQLKHSFTKQSFSHSYGYQLNKSTNELALSEPNLPKGYQLWYTPIHQAHGRISYHNQKSSITYQHQFFGESNGINENLEAYQIGRLEIDYKIHKGANLIMLSLLVDNIWNSSYRIIERRAMPGRSFNLTFKLKSKH